MQTSQNHPGSGLFHKLYHRSVGEIEPYCLSQFHNSQNNECFTDDNVIQQRDQLSSGEQFFTLESSPPIVGFAYTAASPFAGIRTPLSPQGSHSCISDPSPDNTYSGSPLSNLSSMVTDNVIPWKQRLKGLEISLLGPPEEESQIISTSHHHHFRMTPSLDLKNLLIRCSEAVSEDSFDDSDSSVVESLMDTLGQMVSVSGDPIQRLGAYLLEGLHARLESSGSIIYKSLKCEQTQPTSKELMSYMSILYQICPYWKFAYTSANAVIREVTRNESRIHIIDFQIAQGSQWMLLFRAMGRGASRIRITGVDDSQSAHARGGGLELVGRRLKDAALLYGIEFEFCGVGMLGWKFSAADFGVRDDESLVVNFPFVLHHTPDESVSTENRRDRLLRFVRGLCPAVVTLTEQESNTNTAPFRMRFREAMDYYAAMFESIDAGRGRDDRERISAEQHCVARDIVNVVACEGEERVERHELLGKWRARFMMAGFKAYPLGETVRCGIRDLLREYDGKYRLEERNGALYLGWMNRALATASAWKPAET